MDRHLIIRTPAQQLPTVLIVMQRVRLQSIQVRNTALHGALDQVRVELGAEPVCVRVGIVGAGGHEQRVEGCILTLDQPTLSTLPRREAPSVVSSSRTALSSLDVQ